MTRTKENGDDQNRQKTGKSPGSLVVRALKGGGLRIVLDGLSIMCLSSVVSQIALLSNNIGL